MKFGIAIPTMGNSEHRLEWAISSIRRFTEGFDYEILVSDDCTPRDNLRFHQEAVAKRHSASYRSCKEWSYISGNFHAAGMELAPKCDVLVFFADDCLASQKWLEPIQYYYEHNANVAMVSGVMIEAWELAMNDVIADEDSMYDLAAGGVIGGTVMREDLTYSWAQYVKARDERRLHIDLGTEERTIGVLGTDEDGNYSLPRPVPFDGGLGPCFSIRSDAFVAVDGLTKFPFTGDFECGLGWLQWERGLKCVLVPSPPVYHARGLASHERDDSWPDLFLPQWDGYRVWAPAAVAKFKELWGYENFGEAQKFYLEKYVYPATDAVNHSEFMPHEEWKP